MCNRHAEDKNDNVESYGSYGGKVRINSFGSPW